MEELAGAGEEEEFEESWSGDGDDSAATGQGEPDSTTLPLSVETISSPQLSTLQHFIAVFAATIVGVKENNRGIGPGLEKT